MLASVRLIFGSSLNPRRARQYSATVSHYDRMDQNAWWSTVALEGWSDRPGPRYRRLADAIEGAVDGGLLAAGQRVPAERVLADLLGVSRGTVVRAFDESVAAGILGRLHGSGTFVRARPRRMSRPPAPVDEPDPDLIDLSLAGPPSPDHLPVTTVDVATAPLDAAADPVGLRALREALARRLGDRLGVPTTPEQLLITAGTSESLTLLRDGLGLHARDVLAGCPAGRDVVRACDRWDARVIPVSTDAFGIDVTAVQRLQRRVPEPVLLLSATTGPRAVPLTDPRRRRLAQLLGTGPAIAVEEVSETAWLSADSGDGAPLSALSDQVVAVGDLDRLFWAGLGIGWVRIPDGLRASFTAPAGFRPPGVASQLLAARLLAAAEPAWFADRRARCRHDGQLLSGLLAAELPAWIPEATAAGPGLWVRLPVPETTTFSHVARRFGVVVSPGAGYCLDGAHHDAIWLSSWADEAVLRRAVDALAAAWRAYTQRVAATV